MDFILYTSCVIFFMALVFISCVESEGKEGLIFDRFGGFLFQLPNKIPKKVKCGAWAIACPASLSEGEKLMKNALIVRKIYDKDTNVAEVNIKACEETYKPALTYDIIKNNFLFGFAIYHEQYYHRADYKRYMTPEQITEVMQKHPVIKGKYIDGILFESMNDVKKSILEYQDEFWINNDYRMEFMWIHLFSLKWDFFNKIPTRIVYNIHAYSKWPAGERCTDYDLGSEVYDERDVEYVDKLYSKANQNKIFENIKIPVKKTGQVPTETPCDLHKICLYHS